MQSTSSCTSSAFRSLPCRLCLLMSLLVPLNSARGELIDSFDSSVLNPAWTKTDVLKIGTSDHTFDTNSVSGALTIRNPSAFNGVNQQTLLRNDRALGVGETLYTTVRPFSNFFDTFGLAIAASNTPNGRRDLLGISFFQDSFRFFAYYFDASGRLRSFSGSYASATGLFIRRSSAFDFELGYLQGSTRSALFSFRTDNSEIGNSVGYFADIRSTDFSASFDEIGIMDANNVVPEPSPLLPMLYTGALWMMTWRRRKH